jgi:hypothetical protein
MMDGENECLVLTRHRGRKGMLDNGIRSWVWMTQDDVIGLPGDVTGLF